VHRGLRDVLNTSSKPDLPADLFVHVKAVVTLKLTVETVQDQTSAVRQHALPVQDYGHRTEQVCSSVSSQLSDPENLL
jgi:hypothetical protein